MGHPIVSSSQLAGLLIAVLVIVPRISLSAAEQDVMHESPDTRFERARALQLQGNYAAADEVYAALRGDFPGNVDYALGRAQALAQLRRDDEALDELRLASAMAPDYEDVWKLRFVILARQNNADAGHELDELRAQVAGRFPNAQWWVEPPKADFAKWTILAGAGVDSLDNNLPDWNHQFVELHADRHGRAIYVFRMARDARFEEEDLQFSLATDWKLPDDWFAGADLGYASDASIVPNIAYGVHVGKSIDGGWVLDLRYRRREYSAATAGSMIATVEKYVGAFRVAYSLSATRLQSEGNSLGHTVTVNWYPSDATSFGLSMTSGEEAESIGPGQVLETDVRGLNVSGRHKISERFGVSWWLGIHDQGDFYRRSYGGMAVSFAI